MEFDKSMEPGQAPTHSRLRKVDNIITKGVTLTGTNTKEDKFERFEQWLRENGAQFEMLELRAYEDDVSKHSVQFDNESCEEKKEIVKEDGANNNSSDDNKATEASEMRGVHANFSIPPNTVCVSVPRSCLITVEMGQGTEIGQAILNSDIDLDAPKHIFLMVYILWDRKVNGEKSFFKPYYDILPKTLQNMPIFWSLEELRYLQGSYLLAQITDRNEAITEDYHSICQIYPNFPNIASLDEFKWARMCVCSRNFGLQIDGHRTSALVPHADMLNHYRPRETKWTFDDERQSFTITTLQTIPSGAQVYDSYGQKCNHRFLLNYGFAVEDNREVDGFCPNEVSIELEVAQDDAIYDAKYEFWCRGESCAGNVLGNGGVSALAAAVAAAGAARANNMDTSAVVQSAMNAAAAFVESSQAINSIRKTRSRSLSSDNSVPLIKRIRVCVSNNENTRALFSMIRVLACNEAELNNMSASSTTSVGEAHCPGYMSRALLGLSASSMNHSLSPHAIAYHRTCRDVRHPVNIRNERAALKILLTTIGRTLELYPTSLVEDVQELKNFVEYPMFSNKRHAKIQVRGEKEVLHHFILWARSALDVISVIEKELEIERGIMEGKYSEEKLKNVPRFEYVVHAIEDEEGRGIHHTIVRYCVDVLGSLRREELKNMRRSNTATSL
eukprot:CAMPEP_0197835956 /NCGR_PEP_ID=MMETSP1437-20131217/27483_1 /TAXON_ID=49252 ORGANISM="Eucampia antarctica, Strain CCMP1452" /NCGR_SAMPLE_ID=MMETSP1437 /ASSEMBLY_ACC=CAM_ASM_001096 /LENGTH=671 /DNA_ID=CAMNT_0043441771 /DNA_START=90 /DNA_END=2105 /DNA_ORIENTATION=-